MSSVSLNVIEDLKWEVDYFKEKLLKTTDQEQ
jgi:hypothetical protein